MRQKRSEQITVGTVEERKIRTGKAGFPYTVKPFIAATLGMCASYYLIH